MFSLMPAGIAKVMVFVEKCLKSTCVFNGILTYKRNSVRIASGKKKETYYMKGGDSENVYKKFLSQIFGNVSTRRTKK